MSKRIPFPTGLLPQTPGLTLEQVELAAHRLTLTLRTSHPTARCPLCGTPSARVHSHYTRTVADLPWAGSAVQLLLQVRKFFCQMSACPRRIFTERLPQLVAPYARTTARLQEVLRLIAFALGGEAGARLLARLSMVRSPATLLALIRTMPTPTHATSRVLGVDDWAKRKGTSYGTILVDLEQHRPVDLLPDRTAETLTTWLQEHPGTEIITRDRSDQYAKGATAGAPDAIQIADRWHLIRNWAEVVERVLKRHHIALRQIKLVMPLPEEATAATLLPAKTVNRRRKYAEERRERARQERLERWTTIRDQHAKGAALTDIARELRLNYKTVRKYAQATECPHMKVYPPRQRLVAPYEPYLRARWTEGCRNGVQLYREIAAHGFTGSCVLVSMVVAQFRRDEGLSLPWLPAVTRQKPLLPRDGVNLILQRPADRTFEEQTALEELRVLHTELHDLVTVSERYTAMFRERRAAEFNAWVRYTLMSVSKEVRQFVHQLRKDEAAVRAALEHAWSNGQVEGQVHRLKLIKRSMYDSVGECARPRVAQYFFPHPTLREVSAMSLHLEPIGPVSATTAAVARAAFPHGNVYLAMRDLLGTVWTDQDFIALFPRRGQPAYAPWRLALVTLMQFAEGLSDRQAADAVRARIDWKYALNLELTDPGFDFSLLSEFRTRLLNGSAEHLLLDLLLTEFKQRDLLKVRGQQRTDSTHVLAAIRNLNRLECIGETMRAALNSLANAHPTWLQQHGLPPWADRYQDRVQDYRLPKSKAERVAFAEIIGADGFHLLTAVSDPTAPPSLRNLPALVMLRRVWIQQFEAPCYPVRWRDNAELPPAAILIQSPYDSEAHFGIKRATKWTGYKVHLTETCDDAYPALITHVETTTATVTDNEVVEAIHQALATRKVLPSDHIVDNGYMDARGMVTAATIHHIDLLGPVHADTNWQARQGQGFAAAEFDIQWVAQRVICPQGHQSSYWRARHDHTGHDIVAVGWSWKTCKICPALAQCTQKQQGPRTLKLRNEVEHVTLQAARQRQTTDAFRTQYRHRAGIEGTLAQTIRTSGLRQTRYRGLAKTHVQHVLTAVARNAVRATEWLVQKPKRKPHRSAFAILVAPT